MPVPTAPPIEQAGFHMLTVGAPTFRLVIASYARSKEGKSHFYLTAPQPIAVINLDRPLEHLLRRFPGIVLAEYVPQEGLADLPKWEATKRAILSAFADPRVKTVAIDTGSDLWRMIRLARHGKLSSIPPLQYQSLNKEYWELLSTVYNTTKSLIITHRLEEEWGKPGVEGMEGFKHMENLVEVVLQHVHTAQGFGVIVQRCAQAGELRGRILGAGTTLPSDFSTLGTLIVPGTQVGHWQ